MIKLLLTGTFCSLNKGDAAMQVAAYRSLKAVLPSAEIAILTPHPEIDRTAYPDYALLAASRRKPVIALNHLLRAALWRLATWLLNADLRWLLDPAELRALAEADVLVDLSGDTLSEDYGIPCVLSHLMPIVTALLLQRPVVLLAQTLGPFRRTLPLAKRVLDRVTLITAREEQSFDYVRSLGIAKPSLELTADVAFLLECAHSKRVDPILAAEGVSAADAPLVGIAASGLLGHRFRPGNPDQLDALLARVADHLIEKLGVTVVLLSHVLGPGAARDDRAVARRVYEKLAHKHGARLVLGDYRPEELKGVIGRLELFVGMRMHANIAALGMGVPTVAIAYSRKTRGIMQMLGQQRWVCEIDSLTSEALCEMLESLWGQRDHVRDELQDQRGAVEQRARENALLVRRLVESRRQDRGSAPPEL